MFGGGEEFFLGISYFMRKFITVFSVIEEFLSVFLFFEYFNG